MQTVKKNLVLLGMMAVGKTTLGKIIAKELGLEFIDTDKNSMKIIEIFEKKGEQFFRNEEEKVASESLKKQNCVIALGGGAFLNKTLREYILKNSISFWLDDDIKTLSKRTVRKSNRPLLKNQDNEKKMTELYKERKNIYKLANYKIDCHKLSKNYVIKQIIELYEKN